MHLEEMRVVRDRANQMAHLVRLIRRLGEERVEVGIDAIDVVGRGDARRIFEIVRREVRKQLANRGDAVFVGVRGEVRDAGDLVVRVRAA